MDRREAILQASLKLITQHGFHATPVSAIAKEAKVAAGTLYHYFETKDEMIQALYGELKRQMGQALSQSANQELPYKERFFAYWKNLFFHFVKHPLEFQFLEQYSNSPLITYVTREENAMHYAPVIAFLQEGIDKGHLVKMPIDLMTGLVYGAIVTAVKLHLNKEVKMEQGNLEFAIQFSWNGVKA